MSSATACVIREQPLQGFGSVLGFEHEQPKYENTGARSLRRTLSAVDMSSDELQIDQQGVEQKNDISQQQPGQFDIWCSIQIQKPASLPPPYVHPLIKKSKSCLSLRSLEICTENLGSESGSGGYPRLDVTLSDTDEEQQEFYEEEAIRKVAVEETKISDQVVKVDVKEEVIMNYGKKSPSVIPKSFPPPLNSFSRPGGGIQMTTHRIDGRFVLKAVSVPTSQNCFTAQRQDGRLVLTFAPATPESKSFVNEKDVSKIKEEAEFECGPGKEIEESIMGEEEDDKGVVLEVTSTRVPKLQPTAVMNVHRSALSSKNNSVERMIDLGEVLPLPLPISPPTLAAREAPLDMSTLPQQTVVVVAAASLFSMYQYSWRKETTSNSMASDVGGIYH